jgi:hypothetical protein
MGSSYARPRIRERDHLTCEVYCSSSGQFSCFGMMLLFWAETITRKSVGQVHLEYLVGRGFATRGRSTV